MVNHSAKLPWLNVQLEKICSKPQYGYTTKASNVGQVKFLRTTDITKKHLDWDSVPYCESAPSDLTKYQLKDRDIVISRAGSVGFSCLLKNVPESSVFASYLIRFKPSEYISETYLKRFLESHDYWSQLALMSAGNAVQNVNAQKLAKIELPLPPLAEQKVIAETIDTLLAQVETTKNHLERIPEILKLFRQSVLSAAVSGKLTEEWRKGKEIVWQSLIMDDIGEVKGGKRLPKGDELVEDNTGFPYIRAGQLKQGTVINSGDARSKQLFLTPATQKKISQYTVNPGDLYLTIVGASIGDAGVIPEHYAGANLTENAAKITGFKKPVESKFLSYWLRSHELQELIRLEIKSGAQGKLALKRIKELPVPYTDISEQTEIVLRVEERLAFANHIEQKANAALEQVNSLTQSILTKAFRGELTIDWRAANPDLISGENSAEALLKKIKIEREILKKQPQTCIVSKKKESSTIMANKLISVLEEASDWIAAQEAFRLCGVSDGTPTERIEELYSELRALDKAGRLQINTVTDEQGRKLYDCLKLAGA